MDGYTPEKQDVISMPLHYLLFPPEIIADLLHYALVVMLGGREEAINSMRFYYTKDRDGLLRLIGAARKTDYELPDSGYEEELVKIALG